LVVRKVGEPQGRTEQEEKEWMSEFSRESFEDLNVPGCAFLYLSVVNCNGNYVVTIGAADSAIKLKPSLRRARRAPSQNWGGNHRGAEKKGGNWESGPAPIADRGAVDIGYFARSDTLLNLGGDLS
jgi:hypothetical protein